MPLDCNLVFLFLSLIFTNTFLSFEKSVSLLDRRNQKVLPEFRDQLQSLAYKYYYAFSSHKFFSSIVSRADIQLLNSFSRDRSIVVSKPDKGRGEVIVDRDRHDRSMNDIIFIPSRFSLITEPIHKFRYASKIK